MARLVVASARSSAVFLSVLGFVAAGCSRQSAPHGVFYAPTVKQLVPLILGGSMEMGARAVPVAGTRPVFVVNVLDPQLATGITQKKWGKEMVYEIKVKPASPSAVRIATNLIDQKGGPFQPVSITATPVEGKPGVYRIQPDSDLSPGLCAVVVGFDDQLLPERNNVYPFVVPGTSPPTAASDQPQP